MSDSENIISIRILDRDYKIKCPPDEAQELQAAARYVDDQMRKVRSSGSVTSTDRVAVVTALNVSHELMSLKKQKNNYIDMMNTRISDLQGRIQNFLTAQEEVAV